MWAWQITWFSHFFHIIFILFSHFGARNLGPGPKAAAGQARPGPRAAALGPRPGSWAPKCENNMTIIWKNVKIMWFAKLTLFSHSIHIIFVFLSHFGARDPDPGHKSHILIIFLIIFVSYYFHISVYPWAGAPVHSAIFEKAGGPCNLPRTHSRKTLSGLLRWLP